MTEHFTKNTVAASLWCLKCGRQTMHRIDNGRKGPCLDCIDKLENKPSDLSRPTIQGVFKFRGQ